MAAVGAEAAGERRWWDLGLIFFGGGNVCIRICTFVFGCRRGGYVRRPYPLFIRLGLESIFLLFCKGSCARSARSCVPGLLAISRYFLIPKPFHRYIDRLLTVVGTVGWKISPEYVFARVSHCPAVQRSHFISFGDPVTQCTCSEISQKKFFPFF